MKYKLLLWIISILFANPLIGIADTIPIYYISDTHSNLTPSGPRKANLEGTVGGIARAASVIGQGKTDTNALFFHGGDFFIGDFFFNVHFAVPELSILKTLGCNAMVLGNHEADLDINTLNQVYLSTLQQTGELFPFISSNLQKVNTSDWNEVKNNILEYKIFPKGEKQYRIAVFGMTHPWGNMGLDTNKAKFESTKNEIYTRIDSTIRKIKNEGCDAIVMLSHLGVFLDSSLVKYFDDIDLVIGAHDHYTFEQAVYAESISGKKIPIVQSGAFYQNVGKVELVFNDNRSIDTIICSLIKLDESIPEEPTVKSIIDGLKSQIEEVHGQVFSEQIGTLPHDLFEQSEIHDVPIDSLDTPAGNFICDAYLDFAKKNLYSGTQIAIQPNGSICQEIKKGPITREDMFKLVGYGFNTVNHKGFRVRVIKIQGQYIWALISAGLTEMVQSDDMLLQASGLNYKCKGKKDGNLIRLELSSVYVGDTPLNPEEFYYIVANEYAIGYINMNEVPFEIIGKIDSTTTEYDILVDYVKTNPVFNKVEGNIEVPVKETELINNIIISPNPCKEYLNFNITDAKNEELIIEICDNLGNILKSIRTIPENDIIMIDTHDLSSGLYFYRIKYSNIIKSGKFVKL